MSDRTYRKAAEGLKVNARQWEAYESTSHCIVLAGPGSGKTKTLTTKLARILAEDVHEPRGVACITFNNECAKELEDRLSELDVEPSKRVFIGTVHSFSLTQIILPYAKVADMGLPDDFEIASRDERIAAFAVAAPTVFRYPGDLSKLEERMSQYRRKYVDRSAAVWRDTDPDLVRLVEAFEAELRRCGLIDFDDMPLLACRALTAHSWLRQALLAKYPVLVVDEYQDLGIALHWIVQILCFSTGIRLFAVGDIDQSIYGFTGARPELLRALSERADVQTVRLSLNYRSGNALVAMSRVALGEERDYTAANEHAQGFVFVHSLDCSYERQAEILVRQLIPQALARYPRLGLGDVAVLYSAAWLGDKIADAAQTFGVPVVRADSNALYPRASRLMQWLELCGRWCCGGWRTGKPRFSRVMSDGHRLFSTALSSEAERMEFQRRLVAALWAHRESGISVHDWLADLKEVFDPLASRCVGLRDEMQTYCRFAQRVSPEGDLAGISLGELAGEGQHQHRLALSTIHSAKGREFGLVFLFAMEHGRLPRDNLTARQRQDARRTFYVGVTRAKLEVHLVHTLGRASVFVQEIQDHLTTHES